MTMTTDHHKFTGIWDRNGWFDGEMFAADGLENLYRTLIHCDATVRVKEYCADEDRIRDVTEDAVRDALNAGWLEDDHPLVVMHLGPVDPAPTTPELRRELGTVF
jgi:hypothetical protein|tara:strand:+ start:439 stop:753 length:315 start_codon:yes stop_codon:yes gene_type:complete